MKSIDKVMMPCKGIFSYNKYDKHGNLLESVTDNNVILLLARNILRDLVVGKSDANIGFLGFGDLNRSSDDYSEPEPAKESDTGLVSELGRVPVVAASTEMDGKPTIIYTAILDYGDLNGTNYQLLSEYCLITNDDRAFNKRNRKPIIKSSEYRYEFKWTIQFGWGE